MQETMKLFLKRRMATAVPYYLALNAWKGLRNRLQLSWDKAGSTHAARTVAESLEYIEGVYRTYCFYGELQPADIRGRRVLEIGPGDSFGVALRFLLDGAGKVVCLDRFYSYRDTNQQAKIYAAMQERFGDRHADLFEAIMKGVRLTPESGIAGERLHYIHGIGIEQAVELFPAASFDLIVSTAVLEHVLDPDAALDTMDYLLASGGMMLHQIDFRDHEMLTSGGQHPLAFLTLPDRLWRRMTSNSGGALNRKRFPYYRDKLARMGYTSDYHISNVLGGASGPESWRRQVRLGIDYSDTELALVRQIRPKLQPEFRRLSDDDLLVMGLFVSARKLQFRSPG